MVGCCESIYGITLKHMCEAIPACITALWGEAPFGFCIPFGGEFRPCDWVGMFIDLISI